MDSPPVGGHGALPKVGLALHAVHMKHIVHRDLKPSNILLRDINTPLLTDFGIAQLRDLETRPTF